MQPYWCIERSVCVSLAISTDKRDVVYFMLHKYHVNYHQAVL